MSNEPVIVEQTYDAPVSKVWKAITDKDDMKQWYFDLDEFKPQVGFEFQFKAGKDENNLYLHICKVTEVIVDRKLSYNWRFYGYEGNSVVTFELSAEGKRTKLKLSHGGLESFPKSNPDLAKKNFAAGWTAIIGTQLKNFLEKNT